MYNKRLYNILIRIQESKKRQQLSGQLQNTGIDSGPIVPYGHLKFPNVLRSSCKNFFIFNFVC